MKRTKRWLMLFVIAMFALPMAFMFGGCGKKGSATPSEVKSVTAIRSGIRDVVLTWAAPDSDGGSAITKYMIGYQSRPGDFGESTYIWSAMIWHDISTPLALTHTFEDLPDAEYNFQVRAHNANGIGSAYFGYQVIIREVTIEVVGGTGGGTYRHGDMVTITSNDPGFEFWRTSANSTVRPRAIRNHEMAKSTYTFEAWSDATYHSIGESVFMGYALFRGYNSNFDFDPIYTFDPSTSNPLVRGLSVESMYNNGTAWVGTSTFTQIVPGGQSVFTMPSAWAGNSYMAFWIFKDIDGSYKALLDRVGTGAAMRVGLEIRMPYGPILVA